MYYNLKINQIKYLCQFIIIKNTQKVEGNKCFFCIPGKCLDNKETQIVIYAEKKINDTVDEKIIWKSS